MTDKTENALKIAGDVYTARLFTLVAARLGLDALEGQRAREAEDARRHLPVCRRADGDGAGRAVELTIVLILVLELVLFFLGVMR